MFKINFGTQYSQLMVILIVLVSLFFFIVFSKSSFGMTDDEIFKLDYNAIQPTPFRLANGKTVLKNNCLPRSTVGPDFLPNPFPSSKCAIGSQGKMVAANSFGFLTPCDPDRPKSCDLTTESTGSTGFTGPDVPSNSRYDYSTNACEVVDLGNNLGTPYNIYPLSGNVLGPSVIQYDGINVVPSDGYSDSLGAPFLRCDKTTTPLKGCDNYILQVPSTNQANSSSLYRMTPNSTNQTCVRGEYIMDV